MMILYYNKYIRIAKNLPFFHPTETANMVLVTKQEMTEMIQETVAAASFDPLEEIARLHNDSTSEFIDRLFNRFNDDRLHELAGKTVQTVAKEILVGFLGSTPRFLHTLVEQMTNHHDFHIWYTIVNYGGDNGEDHDDEDHDDEDHDDEDHYDEDYDDEDHNDEDYDDEDHNDEDYDDEDHYDEDYDDEDHDDEDHDD
jgi:hypothetical protein